MITFAEINMNIWDSDSAFENLQRSTLSRGRFTDTSDHIQMEMFPMCGGRWRLQKCECVCACMVITPLSFIAFHRLSSFFLPCWWQPENSGVFVDSPAWASSHASTVGRVCNTVYSAWNHSVLDHGEKHHTHTITCTRAFTDIHTCFCTWVSALFMCVISLL